MIPTKPHKSTQARVLSAMAQIRPLAELIYSDNDSSYEKFRCPKENEEITEYDKSMRFLCEEIKEVTGVEPTIYTSKDNYCSYSALPYGGYYCIDSSGHGLEIIVNPSDNRYCNGINLSCPPSQDQNRF